MGLGAGAGADHPTCRRTQEAVAVAGRGAGGRSYRSSIRYRHKLPPSMEANPYKIWNKKEEKAGMMKGAMAAGLKMLH